MTAPPFVGVGAFATWSLGTPIGEATNPAPKGGTRLLWVPEAAGGPDNNAIFSLEDGCEIQTTQTGIYLIQWLTNPELPTSSGTGEGVFEFINSLGVGTVENYWANPAGELTFASAPAPDTVVAGVNLLWTVTEAPARAFITPLYEPTDFPTLRWTLYNSVFSASSTTLIFIMRLAD